MIQKIYFDFHRNRKKIFLRQRFHGNSHNLWRHRKWRTSLKGDYIQPYEDVKEESKECHPGGETDEEKNNIKIVLGGIEAPELIQVGTTSVELKWRALAKAEQLKEGVFTFMTYFWPDLGYLSLSTVKCYFHR